MLEIYKDEIIILRGDFNARTASKGGKIEETKDKEFGTSSDKKIDEEIKELIKWLKNKDFIINGNKQGDNNDEMTYLE